MATTASAPRAKSAYEIDVEDVEYLRDGDTSLLARLYKPRGTGPFPLMIDLHGGAWCTGDRMNDTVICEALAKSGVVVAALDFRMPPQAGYPGSIADIHYAIRWLKSRATQFKIRPDKVGGIGISSGGHQGMLIAMRPDDPRYAALKLDGQGNIDGTLQCFINCWPVIDPRARYHYAQKLKAGGGTYPEAIDRVLPLHMKYWGSEEAMEEGNPVRILEQRREGGAATGTLRPRREGHDASTARSRPVRRRLPQARRRGRPGAVSRRGRGLCRSQRQWPQRTKGHGADHRVRASPPGLTGPRRNRLPCLAPREADARRTRYVNTRHAREHTGVRRR